MYILLLNKGEKHPEQNALSFWDIDRLGNKEVMPMIESSKCMGHQVGVNRLCAGAVL